MDGNAAAFEIALRTVAGLLFLEAAAGKLRDRAGFEGVVANYRIAPGVLAAPVAWVLPPIEIVLAVALLAGLVELVTAIAAASLLTLFAGAMAVNLARGRTAIDCGCGRAGLVQPIGWGRVARNLILAVLLLATAAPSAASAGAWALGLVAGLGLFVLDYALAHLNALTSRRAGAPA